MNELVPLAFHLGEHPALAADLMASIQASLDEDFNNLGGSAFRVIRPRKMDFMLVDGQQQEIVEAGNLYGVLVCASPVNHCVWYADDYGEDENKAPDLVWNWPDPTVFPDALPKQFHQKVNRKGQPYWDFQIRRRTIWLLCRNDPLTGQMGLDISNPWVLDLTSMSMYGKSDAQQNVYKFSGLKGFCAAHSSPSFTCTPSMFVTKIVPDGKATVTGVVCFRPQIDSQGHIAFIDADSIRQIYNLRNSAEVQDLKTVREKLTLEGVSQTAQPAQTISAATPPWEGAATAQPAQPVVPTVVPTQVTPVAPVQPTAQPTPGDTSSMSALLASAQQILQGVAPSHTTVEAPKPMPQPNVTTASAQSAAPSGDLSASITNMMSALM